MTTNPRDINYTVTLDTLNGPREMTGTATAYGRLSDHQTKAAIAQHATAGTSTPIKHVHVHPAPAPAS